MSLTNPDKPITKQDLKDFYDGIFPYLGGMPDILANKFAKGDMYSTDEKIIGQWIDGKPLYQKTLQGEIDVDTDYYTKSYEIDVSALNIDNFINYEAFIVRSSTIKIVMPFDTFNAATSKVYTNNCWYDNGILKIESNRAAYDGLPVYVTIRYTKTTDSAVSIGNDTDYSTTEKIVGTWIDDKPLYQRTFIKELSGITNGTPKTIDVATIADLAMARDAWGYCYGSFLGSSWTISGTVYFIRAQMSGTTLQIQTNRDVYNNKNCYVTLQYTKSTD